ncbi:MAG: hypothetical protein M0Z29_10960 [Actinomycetota bacterium]|nr:hypothetical protein [Actinomycetota bacterium]
MPAGKSRKGWRLMAAAISVGLVVYGVSLFLCASSPIAPAEAKARAATGAAVPSGSRNFAGPYGVEASWVIRENRLPGTTAWKITGPQTRDGIMGYSNRPQATYGQRVDLYVSTTAKSFVVQAYRMGYYQGKGARLVWTSKPLFGAVQRRCPASPPLYMVQCNWTMSTSFTVTKAFVQGDYLLKLVGNQGQQSYVPLTVWDPASHAAYVVMNAVFTWQAFNSFGGYDLYQGGPPGLTGYPPPDRSRIVSFDRPYASGGGSGGFLSIEYPLVRFMEKHGLDVTYWTDINLALDGSLLTNHKALLSLGHDEEWSLRMRENAVAAHAQGVNLAFFGASPILRKVRLARSPLGPNLEMVNYRDPRADPLYGVNNARVTQNWWGQPPANLPASTLVGNSYNGYNNNRSFPLVVTDPGSWLYAGTGLKQGSQLPGLLYSDFDGYNPARPNPPGVQILAHSPVVIGFSRARMYADTTYWTGRNGKGGVFESGTNNWIAAMNPCTSGSPGCIASAVDRMTGNLLKLFGGGPAGLSQPSVANTGTFYP